MVTEDEGQPEPYEGDGQVDSGNDEALFADGGAKADGAKADGAKAGGSKAGGSKDDEAEAGESADGLGGSADADDQEPMPSN